MKFKLDENLGTLGRDLLEAQGYDVRTVHDQDLSGSADELIFAVCRDEGRVLVTLDHDFSQILVFPPELSAGIVVLECKGRLSPAMIRARMREFLSLLTVQEIGRELWIVEPGRIRIREPRSG